MKNNLLLVLCLLAFSVSTRAQLRIGITGGAQSASQKVSASGLSIGTSGIFTGHLGAVAEYSITENLVFRPQLILTGKGGKLNLAGAGYRTTMTYLDIPLQLAYKLEVGPGRVLAGLGPYLGVGLSGKNQDNSSVQFGNGDSDNYRRAEVGFGLLTGYELTDKNLAFNLFYNTSLTNISPDTDIKGSNRVWGLSVTYFFLNR